MSEFDDLLKAADRAMATNNLDLAESIADSLLYKIKAAADDSEYDDPSNPSLDASDDSDDEDDGENDDESDEDDDGEVTKAYHEHSGGNSPYRMRGQHVAVNRPDTRRISATPPPEGPGKLHRFISRANFIKERDGISRAESLTRARQEHPTLYTDYQRHLASRTTRQQHMVRGWDKVGKAAPDTFEDLVATEIRKGCPPDGRVAAQRVAQQFGFRCFDHELFKGESKLTERFEKRVNALIAEGYTGEDACRLVRQADPLLYKAMCRSFERLRGSTPCSGPRPVPRSRRHAMRGGSADRCP